MGKLEVTQLFLESLGRKALFVLLSVETNVRYVQKWIPKLTGLGDQYFQERPLPDYFVRLYLHGPFTASIPTNKRYVY